MNPDSLYNEKIKNILHIIQTIFKSEHSKDILERLHIAGSKHFIEYLSKNNFLPIYLLRVDNQEGVDNTVTNNEAQLNFIKHFTGVREKLDEHIDLYYNSYINKDGNNTEMIASSVKLSHEDVYINIFKRYDSVTNDEDNMNTQYLKQIDHEDINLSSFLSNINFIDHLCNICEIIRSTNPNEQNKMLLNEIKKVNKLLPANVYVPFHRESIRYYIIASMPISEVKIFKTKNRAPYMVTVEAFRVEELTKTLNKEKINDEDFLVKRDHSKTVKGGEIATSKDDFQNRNRSQSFESSLMPNKNEKTKLDYINIDNSKARNTKTFIESGKSTSKQKQKVSKKTKLNYLQEADINLSKPILIKNIYLQDTSNSLNKSHSKELSNLHFEDMEVDTDIREYKKIDDYVHRLTVCNKSDLTISFNKDKKNSNSSDEIIHKDELLEDLNRNRTAKNKTFIEPKKSLIIEEEEKDNSKSDDIHGNEDSVINNEAFDKQSTLDVKGADPVFGEKIEEQTERLRKLSPFGNLATYKLFKFIVKTGEDLRQEQFATQLINEFNQIFKLEKVDCWVSTYEILATGTNCGIIEVIPNSISLDQLYRRVKNYTGLNNFFQTYFGPTNSDKYKRAMDNFVASVAGYSLVCYFLQIKDRHNGNIMIDDKGHIIHIDFGFMLSNAPGKGIKFEKAPFKLTKEFVEVMGGVNSKYFDKFRKLLWK
jgi:hypothetical protein